MQPKVLAIGSSEHSRAHCVDWLQPFPNIEDYDCIVINLQSLTQESYDKIYKQIHEMNESVTTILATDREIFCIMNRIIAPSPTPGFRGRRTISLVHVHPHLVPPTNYSWLPTPVVISSKKKGTSVYVSNHRFDRYFQCVDKWNLEINEPISTDYRIDIIAENKSKKAIGGTLKHFQVPNGAIHLLPPPTKCDTHQAIEILLDLICGERRKIVPPWRKDIRVPRIPELERNIEDKSREIKTIQQEISQLRNRVQEWDSYRDLLTTTGDDLENIVQKALSDIGIKTRKAEESFPADLISNKVAIEVTGIKGCVGVSSEKVNQTGRFQELYNKGQKAILIANTYLDLPPKDREGKMDFSPQVKKFFESLSVCCLTTRTLFQLWRDVVTGEKTSKDVKKAIFGRDGELKPSDFE